MHALIIAVITFVCVFGGAMLGMFIQGFLPGHHLGADSKDSVKLGAALIATMAALVLGILVGSAKTSFDTINTSITQSGAKFILLDRVLAEYGPETAPIRDELRSAVIHIIHRIWPEEPLNEPGNAGEEAAAEMEKINRQLRQIVPPNDSQRVLHQQAMKLGVEVLEARWLVFEQAQNSLPTPFLVVLLFWLTALNLTYGVFAPRNGTVVAVLFACAVSVAGAIFLIVEMDRPLTGMIKISSAPLRETLQFLDK